MFNTHVKSRLSNHTQLAVARKRSDAWDLEDLVKAGKAVRACPFYGARELKTKADIVFCPYNYLVEPSIRKSMEISLKDQVVILDEAHNIEDSARSAASWEVKHDELLDAKADLERLKGWASAWTHFLVAALVCWGFLPRLVTF